MANTRVISSAGRRRERKKHVTPSNVCVIPRLPRGDLSARDPVMLDMRFSLLAGTTNCIVFFIVRIFDSLGPSHWFHQ